LLLESNGNTYPKETHTQSSTSYKKKKINSDISEQEATQEINRDENDLDTLKIQKDRSEKNDGRRNVFDFYMMETQGPDLSTNTQVCTYLCCGSPVVVRPKGNEFESCSCLLRQT
jgi:hypothetical protein